ncbi:GPI mannosyltransferase 1 [Tulasnella sp. 419]|nr:GPI mannosyltransferase 1 [Tulasnella sp. 419]
MPTLQTILRRVTFTQALIVAAVIRLVVVAYIEYHDSHSILKFTDIDYRVFGDATKLILKPDLPKGRLSEGKLAKALGMNFGDPYARDTYRYTPLLALTLLPNEWIHPIWGKLLFSASDLVVGAVLYKIFMMTKGPRQADRKSSPRMAEVAKTEQEAIKWVGGLWLFNPMMIASLGSGFLLGWHMEDTPLAWFTQTVLFVNFNKVCTSQYFMWYMWFLPLVLPNLSISKSRSAILLGSWIIGQAIWLSIAYRLELLGFNVYLPLWGASILFSLINYFILGQILQSYATYKQRIQKQD